MNENEFEKEPQPSDEAPIEPVAQEGQPEAQEQEDMAFEKLPESLGFTSNEELGRISQALTEAYKQGDPAECKRLAMEYEDQAFTLIDQATDPKDRARREIGFNIALGMIREAGGAENAGESFETAYNQAEQEGFEDILAALEKAFD